MLTIYKPPKLRNQFDFEKEIAKNIDRTIAIDIDHLDTWHIEKIINYVASSDIRYVNFCSKREARLYAIALKFKYRLLWFINTAKGYKLVENIDGINFLSISRI